MTSRLAIAYAILVVFVMTYSVQLVAQQQESIDDSLLGQIKKADGLWQAGQQDEAFAVLSALEKKYPEDPSPLFYKALLKSKSKQNDEAKTYLYALITQNPSYSPAHFLLGSIYLSTQCNTLAVLAFMRYLILEPEASRSIEAISIVNSILGGSSQVKVNSGVSIEINFDDKCTDCNMASALVTAGLKKSLSALVGSTPSKPINFLPELYNAFFLGLTDDSIKKLPCFPATHYAPYFIELSKKQSVPAFCALIYKSAHVEDLEKWSSKERNIKKITDLTSWSSKYQWPKK